MGEEAIRVLAEVPKGSGHGHRSAAKAKADLFKFFAARAVPRLQERAALLGDNALVVVQLPDNGRGLPLIEGDAAEDVTDGGETRRVGQDVG